MSAPIPQTAGSNGYAVARNLHRAHCPASTLKPLGRETRKHPPAQARKLAESLDRFGFVLPILIDGENSVVAGWGSSSPRASSALSTSLRSLCLISAKPICACCAWRSIDWVRIEWDVHALKLEFGDLLEISHDIDLTISGFEMGEIDVALGGAIDEEDALPIVNEVDPPLTKLGDLWRLGDHRLLCADALRAESYARLMQGERAQMVFTDPPWNIAIEHNVSGLGAVKHKDFAMAFGEIIPTEFEAFLHSSLGHAAAHSKDGALQYVCMHWSKMKRFSLPPMASITIWSI